MERFQVEECQEINGFETAVEGGRAADFCTQREVGAKQFWDGHRFCGEFAQRTIVCGKGAGAPPRLGQMFAAQIGVSGRTLGRFLRCKGAAAEQVAGSVVRGVMSDSLPQRTKHDEISVLGMHTGSPQFDHLLSQRFENAKLELLLAIVADALHCIVARLQAIRSNHLPRGQMFHDEMIANTIESVFVKAREMGVLEALAEFKVEDLVAQRLRRANLVRVTRQPRIVVSR